MDERNKPAFWLAAVGVLALICVPSLTLLESLRAYRRFLSGFEPATLRATRPRSQPHRPEARAAESTLDFVSFRAKAPKARSVELVGEFNGWKRGTLSLARQGGGVWELLVPLPRGRYHYRFVVDGREQLDAGNADQETVDGRASSVKLVR